jgi:hypothetical protein
VLSPPVIVRHSPFWHFGTAANSAPTPRRSRFRSWCIDTCPRTRRFLPVPALPFGFPSRFELGYPPRARLHRAPGPDCRARTRRRRRPRPRGGGRTARNRQAAQRDRRPAPVARGPRPPARPRRRPRLPPPGRTPRPPAWPRTSQSATIRSGSSRGRGRREPVPAGNRNMQAHAGATMVRRRTARSPSSSTGRAELPSFTRVVEPARAHPAGLTGRLQSSLLRPYTGGDASVDIRLHSKFDVDERTTRREQSPPG